MNEISNKQPIGNPASMPLVELINQRWKKASRDEAQALIEIMIEFHNSQWFDYCNRAEQKAISYSDLIIANIEQLHNSAATGIADWDEMTIRQPYSDDDIEQQRSLLKNYLDNFGADIEKGETNLVLSALGKISK